MKGVWVVLLALFSLTSLPASRSCAQDNERPPACTQWDKIPIPPEDLPTPQDHHTLAGCDSEALYFGIGRPADPVNARKCAYLEREGGDAPIFNGSSLLIMIYANGKGAARNFDLAMRFACEFEEMPGASQGRIEHLLNLRETHWTGDNFSLCDDGGTFMQGVCAQLRERLNAVERAGKLDKIVATWTPTEKVSLSELQKAANKFFQASTDNEVDISGTGRASFITDWRAWLDDGFVAALERTEEGQLPHFSSAEFKAADGQLNAAYAAIQEAKPEEVQMGTVTPEGIRTAQRAWLVYREAWVKFGSVKYPQVSPESWQSWLTYDRILMLRSLPGTEPPQGEAFEPFVPWRYHYELGQMLSGDDGIREIREAIRLKPDWAVPHNALGDELAAKGDWGGAMNEYREAIRLDPNNADAHHNLGFAFEKREDWDGAIREYREVVRLKPQDDTWRFSLIQALERKDDWDGAIKEIREALRLNSGNAVAHDYYGDALAAKKDWDGAIREYRETLRFDPTYNNAHSSLGDALTAKGDWDGAIKEYREVVRLYPNRADSHYNLGKAFEGKNDWDGAVAEFREAVRLKPADSYSHAYLAWSLANKKDWDGAIKEYAETVRLRPDAQAHGNLGWAYEKVSEWGKAVKEYAEAVRLEPSEASRHGALGWALENMKDLDRAIREYREAIRLKPEWAEAYRNLGWALYTKGDLDAAVTADHEAIRLKPDDAQTHYNLGYTLRKKGDVAGAIAELRETIRLQPNASRAHFDLGTTLESEGDPSAAIAEYRKACDLDANNPAYSAVCNKLRNMPNP